MLDKIKEILRSNNIYAQDIWEDSGLFFVDLEGDWKHDHLRADYLLMQIGLVLQEIKQDDSDDDYYRAIRAYKSFV